MKNKVFISTSSFARLSSEPLKILSDYNIGYEMNESGKKLSSERIKKHLKDYSLVIAGTEQYDSNLLSSLSKLKVISRLGVGTDNIDLKAANDNGIKVFKTKTTPANAVTELALGLIIDLSREITKSCNDTKNHNWNKRMGTLLKGKTLGVIGLGVIGREFVKLVKGFEFNVLAFDKIEDDSFSTSNNITYCSLENLLSNSDIVSIHLNLNDSTNKLIDRKKLELMKKDAILINTSRGEIIDEKALYYMLKENKILGAGLDVFENEPYEGPLSQLENVILTPHIGSYAKEIRIKMEIESVKNLIEGLSDL